MRNRTSHFLIASRLFFIIISCVCAIEIKHIYQNSSWAVVLIFCLGKVAHDTLLRDIMADPQISLTRISQEPFLRVLEI